LTTAATQATDPAAAQSGGILGGLMGMLGGLLGGSQTTGQAQSGLAQAGLTALTGMLGSSTTPRQ
jgi:predicted lipid-binding transport protein (Tim44 family)